MDPDLFPATKLEAPFYLQFVITNARIICTSVDLLFIVALPTLLHLAKLSA